MRVFMRWWQFYLSSMKFLSVFILIFSTLTVLAQDDSTNYLETHHYSFSLDKGFDNQASDILKQKLQNYKLVILGESGSHYLQFYNPLRFFFIKFVSEHFGMTHFLMETGHSTDILWNKFLETGDTAYLSTYKNPSSIKSNWQLKKIERDILNELLKYCKTDFTLFDFMQENKQTGKYRKYGQFLIIAKIKTEKKRLLTRIFQ